MSIKIAVIGSVHFCTRVERLVMDATDLQIECHTYEEPNEAGLIMMKLKPSDAILFSGSLPYMYAKETIQQFNVPTNYLKQDETAISTTLLYSLTKEQLPLNRISIDVAERLQIENVLNDINELTSTPHIHVLDENESISELVAFHRKLLDEDQTEIAITSVHAVYEQLQKMGYKVLMMIDPVSSILRSLNDARQQAILKKSSSAQIAVGIIQSNDLSIQPLISEMATQLHAHWSEKNGEYSLFTTMGNIQSSMGQQPFLAVHKSLPPTVRMAFGCGESTMIAADHARLALNFIQASEPNSFYILDANKKLHGPYPQSDSILDMKVDHPTLVTMAEKTKLGPSNISKLLLFSKSRSTTQFSANDLAIYLNVSRRTAERTIKKLMEYDYVNVIGEEMTYKQGRPRALYEFNFPAYL